MPPMNLGAAETKICAFQDRVGHEGGYRRNSPLPTCPLPVFLTRHAERRDADDEAEEGAADEAH